MIRAQTSKFQNEYIKNICLYIIRIFLNSNHLFLVHFTKTLLKYIIYVYTHFINVFVYVVNNTLSL